MKIPSMFKAGALPVIAGTAIFMASTGLAGDKAAVSGVGMEPTPKVVTQEKLDVHELDPAGGDRSIEAARSGTEGG